MVFVFGIKVSIGAGLYAIDIKAIQLELTLFDVSSRGWEKIHRV